MALAATFDPPLARRARRGRSPTRRTRRATTSSSRRRSTSCARRWAGARSRATARTRSSSPRMAVGWIEGAQAQGVIADVKHFAANNQEGTPAGGDAGGPASRSAAADAGQPHDRRTSSVDERTLREIYLPQFEAAVKEAHVGSVMCSYNRLNGAYACENKHLLARHPRAASGASRASCSPTTAPPTTRPPSLNNGLDFEPWPGDRLRPGAGAARRSPRGQVDAGRRRRRTSAASCARCSPTAFFDRAAYADDDAQIDKAAPRARPRSGSRSRRSRCCDNRRRAAARRGASCKSIARHRRRRRRRSRPAAARATSRRSRSRTPREAITERAGRGRAGRPTTTAATPTRAAALAKAADVAIVVRRRLPDRGRRPRVPDARVPARPRRPGRADRARSPRRQPEHDRRARDRRPGADAVARQGRRRCSRPGTRASRAAPRSRACCSATPTRAAACPPRSRSARPTMPTAGDPEKYPGVGRDT